MRMLTLLAVVAATLAAPAHAQSKKELVQKVLQLQQAAVEAMARGLVEQPAALLQQEAGVALQRLPADKRESTAKEIQADIRKYVDDTVPVVQQRAVKLAPETIGAILEQNLSEDELKQVIGYLESPVQRKFQQLTGDMERSLAEKLVTETRPQVNANLRTLRESMSKRLGLPAAAASAPTPAAKPPARPASAARK